MFRKQLSSIRQIPLQNELEWNNDRDPQSSSNEGGLVVLAERIPFSESAEINYCCCGLTHRCPGSYR